MVSVQGTGARMPESKHMDGHELARRIADFAMEMAALADRAGNMGVRAVELTAQDAADAALALLDVLEGPAREKLTKAV